MERYACNKFLEKKLNVFSSSVQIYLAYQSQGHEQGDEPFSCKDLQQVDSWHKRSKNGDGLA